MKHVFVLRKLEFSENMQLKSHSRDSNQGLHAVSANRSTTVQPFGADFINVFARKCWGSGGSANTLILQTNMSVVLSERPVLHFDLHLFLVTSTKPPPESRWRERRCLSHFSIWGLWLWWDNCYICRWCKSFVKNIH